MKENRWDSTLHLLIPTWRGPPWQGFPPPAVWEGMKGVGWAGGAGPTAPPSSTFSSRSISGKTSPGVHAAAGLSRTLQTWGAERQLIEYLQRVESPFCLDTLPPLSAHTPMHTCTHRARHRNPPAFVQLSIQTHPCPIQLNKHMCYLCWKDIQKNVCTSSCILSWKLKSCFIHLMEEQIRNCMRPLANLPEDEIWSSLVQFSLLVFR